MANDKPQQKSKQAQFEQQKKSVEEKIVAEQPKIKPTFFGYRPPKWAADFQYVRNNKGKGDPSDSETWMLYAVDRLLKKFSI